MADIILVKRGKSSSWLSLNPTLRPGEPGFETDTGKLKIGDGNKAWIELGYVGEGKGFIVNVPTHADFPALGDASILYKASQEKQLYQWNDETSEYELVIDPTAYATKEELQAAIDRIEIPELALEEYATKEYAQDLFNKLVPLTDEEILDVCE